MSRKQFIIQNGNVCDGTGREPVRQDILIEDDRIAETGPCGIFDQISCEKINICGKMIVPGFIDAHAHDEIFKLRFPEMRTKLLQGVTTSIDGNCGSSPSCISGETCGKKWSGLNDYISLLKQKPASINTVALCGHNSIRQAVMGDKNTAPTAEEIHRMRQIMEKTFEVGAAGWSTGLTYFPGKFSDTSELLALAEITKGSGKIYTSHIRSEGDDLIHAVEEAVSVAASGSGELEVSHLKTIFPRNFSKINILLDTLKQARSRSRLHADRYPYVYSSTVIRQILPPPYDKIVDIAERLRRSEEYQNEITEALKNSPRDLATTILFKNGKTITQIAGETNISLEEAGMRLLMENPKQSAAYLCMSEENMLRILSEPWVCAGSDGISMQLDDPDSTGHPRAVGTFPRFFRIVSRECGFTEAIRRMTSLPASIFHIPERGTIRKGYYADLLILDPEKYDTHAGFSREDMLPRGVSRVIVNGQTAWDETNPEKVNCAGRFLPV